MSRAKPCPVCGWKGKHPRTVDINCSASPALRRLVRAAERWANDGKYIKVEHDEALMRAVRAWRKKK